MDKAKEKAKKRCYYSCSVFGCLNTTQSCGYTFFTLPNDIEKRTLWLSLIDREDVKNKFSTCLRVCEAHFEDDRLLKTATRTVLKKGSIPKLLLPTKKREHKGSQTTVETTESGTQSETKLLRSYSTQTPKRLLKNENIKERKKGPETNVNHFYTLCDKYLSTNLSNVVKEQVKLKEHSCGNRYSEEYKLFCLNLCKASPRAYNMISETLLNMPSKTTFKRIKRMEKSKIQVIDNQTQQNFGTDSASALMEVCGRKAELVTVKIEEA